MFKSLKNSKVFFNSRYQAFYDTFNQNIHMHNANKMNIKFDTGLKGDFFFL